MLFITTLLSYVILKMMVDITISDRSFIGQCVAVIIILIGSIEITKILYKGDK